MTLKSGLEGLKKGLQTLRPVRLDEVDDWGLTEEDLCGALLEHRASPLLFGQFPAEKVLGDLEQRGAVARLRDRGYCDFEFRNEGPSAFDSRIRLYGRHEATPEPCVLMDVRTHRGELCGASVPLGRTLRIRALIWEWLSFQDPLAPFPEGTTALPGQEHPGLGIFRASVRLMLDYVREMDIDALVGLPQYFHNAVLYSSQFHFFLPHLEGEFQALRRDLLPEGLARCSLALAEGQVVQRESGRKVTWHAAEQVHPIRGEILEHFRHPAYRQEVESVQQGSHFRFARPAEG